jgi:hypothetical protein
MKQASMSITMPLSDRLAARFNGFLYRNKIKGHALAQYEVSVVIYSNNNQFKPIVIRRFTNSKWHASSSYDAISKAETLRGVIKDVEAKLYLSLL